MRRILTDELHWWMDEKWSSYIILPSFPPFLLLRSTLPRLSLHHPIFISSVIALYYTLTSDSVQCLFHRFDSIYGFLHTSLLPFILDISLTFIAAVGGRHKTLLRECEKYRAKERNGRKQDWKLRLQMCKYNKKYIYLQKEVDENSHDTVRCQVLYRQLV